MSRTSSLPEAEPHAPEAGPAAGEDPSLAHLAEVVEHAAHLLPAQGPITVFVHHNTLHAFEDLPFHEAVTLGGRVFGCRSYLSEDRYRDELRRGRIRFHDLEVVLKEDLGPEADQPVLGFGSRLEFRLAMLQYPLRQGPTDELVWFVAETDALRQIRAEASSAVRNRLIAETRRWAMRDLRTSRETRPAGGRASRGSASDGLRDLKASFDEAAVEEWGEKDWESFTLRTLWRVCCDGVRDCGMTAHGAHLPRRHRDLLLLATGVDADLPVHELLIRFCAAYVDQGFAGWHLPHQDRGFFRSFSELYGQRAGPPDAWLRGLPAEIARLQAARMTPLESIRESLALLQVPEDEWQSFLYSTILALRGWGGMVRQVEQRGDRVAHPAPAGSLVEMLAVRLLLDRLSLAHVARTALGYEGALAALRGDLRKRVKPPSPPSIEQRAFLVFQLGQVLGWPPDQLHRLTSGEWKRLIGEIEAFSEVERQRVFHLAYERRFRDQALDALALHVRGGPQRPARPRFQAVFCLDEREESFRRHLEEVMPEVETFGAAGFYSVAMYYRGAADAHFVPLCPVVIRPGHWVVEEVDEELGEEHRRRARTRQVLGKASHRLHLGSRTFAMGAVLTAVGGVFASVPLMARILFPRLTARFRQAVGRIVQIPPRTQLVLERREDTPGPENGHVGFTVDEMTDIGTRLLRDIGLTSGFSRLVLVVGHGSYSMNNPHRSAYDCGACGGAAGGPNARALAQMLNDPRVRQSLARRGLVLPEDTFFVGAFHNTCDDSVTFHDDDRLPASHQAEFADLRRAVEATCERNAHERCRRFMSAPLTLSFREAKTHVEERSEDLAQTRPECGHATNALCLVGGREWTRGLFLDRRAFLVSYDPTQDGGDAPILTRILQAVFPVCAGINLEYYFSYVDSVGWGCGTKLPHNITSLLGVMDGAASDLRTGLPWQMVEIHEPVRLLFLIETTAETMLGIIDKNEGIGRVCRNSWVQLAVFDPASGRIQVYADGTFRDYHPHASSLPTAPSSADWYRGWRDHLEFAAIGS